MSKPTGRPRGHPRTITRAFLDLRPEDYQLLEAAAKTTLKRLHLSSNCWPVEDLIDAGWERVFFYCRTYEQFHTKGFLPCIREMANHIHDWTRRNMKSYDEWREHLDDEQAACDLEPVTEFDPLAWVILTEEG